MTISTTTATASAAGPAVMDRLKMESRADHDETEAIPFSKAIVSRTLPKDRYVAQLAAYAVLHEALERALSDSDHPTVRGVWRDDLRKLPLLNRDLAFFAAEQPSSEQNESSRAAMQTAQEYAAAVHALAKHDPVALLGHLYVLEGSTLGGTILRSHIRDAYDLDEDGLSYYSPYGNAVMPHWREFKDRMNAYVTDADEQDRVVAAARESFRRIGWILRALSDGL
jgi:heme oxygenase